MKGLELSKKFYLEYGLGMLKENFGEVFGLIATGLTGSGSECYGYDDDISTDHDFEPCFCIFLPDEDTVGRKTAFELEKAYNALPKEYMGYTRQPLSPVGGRRHGVIRSSDFFSSKVGSPDGNISAGQWLNTPDFFFCEATNGEIFSDPSGFFTKIRERISYYPEDIRLKKLAGYLLMMAQDGQYNYPRCLAHLESGAAQMSIYRFVGAAINVIFLINRKYSPYYKWQFKAIRGLGKLSGMGETLEFLISSDNTNPALKEDVIEDIAKLVSDALIKEGLKVSNDGNLEKVAYEINGLVKDANIRNMHILCGAV